jgi:hypothetical protein
LIFSLLICSITGAQQTQTSAQIRKEWLDQEKLKHYDFVTRFKTTEYVCEVKLYSKLVFDREKNLWFIDTDGSYYKSKKEFLKIIKSDDIKEEIGLCGVDDEPLSRSSKLNKYFCIVNDHPNKSYATNYKCLLDIERDNPTGKDVHVLNCGKNESLKFVFEGAKFFEQVGYKVSHYEIKVSPSLGLTPTYSQANVAGDCLKVTN